MMGLGGQTVGDQLRRQRGGEMLVDVVKAQDAGDCRDVECALVVSHPERDLKAARDGIDLHGAARFECDGVDLAGAGARHVDDLPAFGDAAQSHFPGIGNGVGHKTCVKPRRQFKRGHRQCRAARPGRPTQDERDKGRNEAPCVLPNVRHIGLISMQKRRFHELGSLHKRGLGAILVGFSQNKHL